MATMLPHTPGTSAWVCRKCQGLPESSGESPSSPWDGGRHHCDSALIILNEDFLPFFPHQRHFLWIMELLQPHQEKQLINTE